MKNKIFMVTVICLLIGFFGSVSIEVDAASSSSKSNFLCKEVYNRVKRSWWTENSSGGDDIKFTRKQVIYYNRDNGKVKWKASIMGCKKLKSGYLVNVKNGKYKYSYFLYKNNFYDTIEFYSSWKRNPNKYSGSASLSKGKWG